MAAKSVTPEQHAGDYAKQGITEGDRPLPNVSSGTGTADVSTSIGKASQAVAVTLGTDIIN